MALLALFVLALLAASLPMSAPLAMRPGDICSSTSGKSLPGGAKLAHCPDCIPAAPTPPAFVLALREELRHALAPQAALRPAPVSVATWPPARGPPGGFMF